MPAPPRVVDIAVIGAGLGGLALAAGLHRRGLRAHVFEGGSTLRKENSTMVGLGPNALTALGDMHPDIPDEIRRRGAACQRAQYIVLWPDGREPYNRTRPGSAVNVTTIRWAETQDALAQLVPPDFVHFDHAVTGYEEIWDDEQEGEGGRPAGRVMVHFRSQPSVTARLVVGADGVFSTVRAAMFPNDSGPRYLGHMNWNCLLYNPGGNTVVKAHEPGDIIYNADNMASDATGAEPSMYFMICDAGAGYTFWQCRMQYDEPTFTKSLTAECDDGCGSGSGSGDSHNLGQTTEPAGNGAKSQDSAESSCCPGAAAESAGVRVGDSRRSRGGQGVPGSKARIIERLKAAGWDWALPLVEATPESALFERALYDRVPLERWASAGSRVVLLGDAAHAMHPGPGQGARMAFEDAHQLTLALEALWPDVPAALERYQRARITRTTRVQAMSAEACGLEAIRSAVKPQGLTMQERMDRFVEFSNWLNQYPANPAGDPESRWFKPPQSELAVVEALPPHVHLDS